MFVLQLGDNLSAKTAIGNKAKLLDFARYSGLPVPKGVIITDEFYQAARRKRVLRLEHGRVVAPNADWLMAMLTDVPPFRKRLRCVLPFQRKTEAMKALQDFSHQNCLFVRALTMSWFKRYVKCGRRHSSTAEIFGAMSC